MSVCPNQNFPPRMPQMQRGNKGNLRRPMGVYRSRKNHRIQIFRFQMRLWRFRATRTKKLLKNRHFLWFSALFDEILGSSCSKPRRSHLKPKNSNSMVSPGSVDTLGHPGGVSIAEWIKNWPVICLSGPLPNGNNYAVVHKTKKWIHSC